MKKFLRKILIFGIIFCCAIPVFFLFGFLVVGNQYQETHLASIIDKVARLKSINEPKIILLGNSNLLFGIDSPMIESAVNMPVVNFAVGAMRYGFLENTAKLNINSGDIIIASYSSFFDDDKVDPAMEWPIIEYHFDLWKGIDEKDYFKMFLYYPGYWARSFAMWLTRQGNNNKGGELVGDNLYLRRAFNEMGEITVRPESNRKTPEEIFHPGSTNVPKINDICINRLNKYNAYLKSKGATLLIAAYPIGYGKFTPPAEEFDKFQHELESRLDCEVISNYRDYFIPYKYFYDTNLHLDNEGAKIRTQQLIKDIQRWQAKRQNKTGNL